MSTWFTEMRKQVSNAVKSSGSITDCFPRINEILSLSDNHQFKQVMLDMDRMYIIYGAHSMEFGTTRDPINPDFNIQAVCLNNFAGFKVSSDY